MKRIMIFFLLCITTISFCFAQKDSKGKEKLPSYDEFINISKPQPTESTDNCIISDNEMAFFIKSIVPELSIIRQQYRLVRDGKRFGKNNKPYYGETYSLAVKVSGGMIFLDNVTEPWKYDPDYKKQNASGNYTPEQFWSYQRTLTEPVYSDIDMELQSNYVTSLNNQKSLFMHTDKHSDFGLSIDNTEGKKDGMMIWVYSKTNVQDSTMVAELRQNSMSLEARLDSSIVDITPTEPEKILGGIFVTPQYSRGGRVQLCLTGVAVKNQDCKWSLQLLATEGNVTLTESKDSTDKRKASKKKNTKSSGDAEPTPIK